jgi:uncharacterized Zn finger protein (UPF0148 family)
MSKTMHGVSSISSARECCARVWQTGRFRSAPCAKPPKVERDGKWFCAIHDPIRIEERNKAREAKWDAEWRESAKRDRLRSAAPALLLALEELLAAVTAEVNEKGAGGFLLARMSDARSAIKSARPEAVEETP